jgi:hypothetical protein
MRMIKDSAWFISGAVLLALATAREQVRRVLLPGRGLPQRPFGAREPDRP